MDKPYTTYEQQIHILESKGLRIDDKEKAIHILKKCGYYSLINGYKNLFKKGEKYIIHSSINDIYSLYKFDKELRELFLRYILIVENELKSLVSYAFCDKYGEAEEAYLDTSNYNYINKNQDKINYLIDTVFKKRTSDKRIEKYPYLNYQKKKHGNVPLWALLHTVTFGNVSQMYSLLDSSVQSRICKEFKCKDERHLRVMLDFIVRIRNVCAHNERLYDYKYNKRGIPYTELHKELGINMKNSVPRYGEKDLYAAVISLGYLLDTNDFIELVERIDKLVSVFTSQCRIVPSDLLLRKMGFPENWREIKRIVEKDSDSTDCAKAILRDEYYDFCCKQMEKDGYSTTKSNVETAVRDTFYLDRNLDTDFKTWFESEEKLQLAKQKVTECLIKANRKKSNLRFDIQYYWRLLDYYYAFIHMRKR